MSGIKLVNGIPPIINYAFMILSICLIYSCNNQEKLNLYDCPQTFDGGSCERGCILKKEFNVKFLVSHESKAVSEIVYFRGKQTGSIIHKECIIFDKKNWDCSNRSDLDLLAFSVKETVQMVDGRYMHKSEWRDKEKGTLRNPNEKASCAELN